MSFHSSSTVSAIFRCFKQKDNERFPARLWIIHFFALVKQFKPPSCSGLRFRRRSSVLDRRLEEHNLPFISEWFLSRSYYRQKIGLPIWISSGRYRKKPLLGWYPQPGNFQTGRFTSKSSLNNKFIAAKGHYTGRQQGVRILIIWNNWFW